MQPSTKPLAQQNAPVEQQVANTTGDGVVTYNFIGQLPLDASGIYTTSPMHLGQVQLDNESIGQSGDDNIPARKEEDISTPPFWLPY